MNLESLQLKWLFKALEKTQFGSVQVNVGGNAAYEFGQGPVQAQLHLRDLSVLSDILKRGDLGLADAVIDGRLAVSDEASFIRWACLNEEALQKAFHGTLVGTLLPKIKMLFRRNTVQGAKKNIIAHYDLGNDFYQQWLDSSMSYSSALFNDSQFSESLTQAQMNKYDRLIDQLNIRSSDHILEVGCGWGGFFTRAIERTGCRVTAVMNSPAQAQHNRNLIERKNMASNVDLQLIDYRSIKGRFDKIVSIEMIEAVGQEYWPTYFSKISSLLKSRGQVMIQSITIKEDRFAQYSSSPDFINSYIFPGGMLLTNSAIATNAKNMGLMSAAPFEFGHSYAETLARWRSGFVQAYQNGLKASIDERFYRLWHFYLSYCEGAFNADRINVGHFHLESR